MIYTDNREGATTLVRREVETGAEQVLPIATLDFGAPTGTLKLRFVDKGVPVVKSSQQSVDVWPKFPRRRLPSG